MVSFTHEGHHYIWGTGKVKNYKFEDTLEYIEQFKNDKTSLIEWQSTLTGKKYYSGIKLLGRVLRGENGEIQQAKTLQVKGNYTFVRIGNGVFLTFSKN